MAKNKSSQMSWIDHSLDRTAAAAAYGSQITPFWERVQ